MRTRTGLLTFTAAALIAATLPAAASAAIFSHAAGFICGSGPTTNRILAGDYRVEFNIRNGSSSFVNVHFELALTFPPGASSTPGGVFSLPPVGLAPGQAVMIDCDELVAASGIDLGQGPPYISGVLAARSHRKLDVTVLQGAGPAQGPVSSLSLTLVPAQRLPGRD